MNNLFEILESVTNDTQYIAFDIFQVFQCLVVDGENQGEDALRNAERYVITDEEFKTFLDRHSNVPTLVPETSDMMKNSYLILDEYVSTYCYTTPL